jgi:hypothetical protein
MTRGNGLLSLLVLGVNLAYHHILSIVSLEQVHICLTCSTLLRGNLWRQVVFLSPPIWHWQSHIVTNILRF